MRECAGRGLERGTDHIPGPHKVIRPCLPGVAVLSQASPVLTLLLNGVGYRVGYARELGAVVRGVLPLDGAHWEVLLPAVGGC